MMSCHEATRLMSESKERTLSARERMALRFHTMMCAGCRRFDGQLDFLRTASRAYTQKPDNDHCPDEKKDG